MSKPARYTQETIAKYFERGYWQPITYGDIWDRNARDYPDKEAIVDLKGRVTWSQAKRWIDRLALKFLELGIKRDEVIVTQLPNWAEYYLLPIACEKAGIMCMPVLRTFQHNEMEHILKRVEAVGVVIPWEYGGFDYFAMLQEIRPNLPKLKHIFIVGNKVPKGALSIDEFAEQRLEEKYPADYLKKSSFEATEIALIRYTSGTTGFPKFPAPPVSDFVYNGRMMVEAYKFTASDIGAALAPAVAGPNLLNYWTLPLVAAKVVMQERFDAGEALRLIEKERVTFIPAVPAILAKLIEHPDFNKRDLSSMRFVWCGGAPLSYQLGKEVEQKFGCPVVQGYGSAESGTIACNSTGDPQEVRLLTVGKPLPGMEVKLFGDDSKEVARGEIGEIWTRGPSCTDGFYRDPQATAQVWTEDGWLKMGDLAKFDEQGNIVLVGRKKDIIFRGGQNIYPVEIEDMLSTHPKVLNVAIVAMPDPVLGEKACAYVVTRQGEPFTFDEMISFLKGKKIATWKLPERLEVLDKLPMVADGQKVDKKTLVKNITEKLKKE